jgi:rhodanese-related sulfurtransferase
MAPFPLALDNILGHWNAYLVFLLIGFAFGYALEIGGFADSRKLAAQFYFKDLTVLKVMFGAIITAMVLIFLAASLGLVDFNLIYVNPTYLWPGVVGGLVMGVGFIVGGFCPGTSLVSAAVLKIDGIFFALGVFFGVFLFGETIGFYEDFWNSSYLGRFTLPEWLGIPTGWVVLLVVLMALFMFWGGEKLEARFAGKELAREPKWRYSAAAVVAVAALGTIFIGQPTKADRWAKIAEAETARLENRELQIHPGELLDSVADTTLRVTMLDLRAEADYNLFHIRDAVHLPFEQLEAQIPELRALPASTLVVVMSNDETLATEAWKILRAERVVNVYILAGGINGWLETFADAEFLAANRKPGVADESLAFRFESALGSRYEWSEPDPHEHALEYTPKIQMERKAGPSGGGCG